MYNLYQKARPPPPPIAAYVRILHVPLNELHERSGIKWVTDTLFFYQCAYLVNNSSFLLEASVREINFETPPSPIWGFNGYVVDMLWIYITLFTNGLSFHGMPAQ